MARLRSPMPTLTYDEAERVGLQLRRMFKGLTGKKKTPALKDEQWADMIQFVMRHAAEQIDQRNPL